MSRPAILAAIREHLRVPEEQQDPDAIRIDPADRSRLLVRACELAGREIPDTALGQIQTVGQLLAALEAPAPPPEMPKGVPALELLLGQELPRNLRLVNYRKKRWSPAVAELFVTKAYEKAGVARP